MFKTKEEVDKHVTDMLKERFKPVSIEYEQLKAIEPTPSDEEIRLRCLDISTSLVLKYPMRDEFKNKKQRDLVLSVAKTYEKYVREGK